MIRKITLLWYILLFSTQYFCLWLNQLYIMQNRLPYFQHFMCFLNDNYLALKYWIWQLVSFNSSLHCSAEQSSLVQCSHVQWSAVQYSAVQCGTVQCSVVQCSSVQWRAVQCSTVEAHQEILTADIETIECHDTWFENYNITLLSINSRTEQSLVSKI